MSIYSVYLKRYNYEEDDLMNDLVKTFTSEDEANAYFFEREHEIVEKHELINERNKECCKCLLCELESQMYKCKKFDMSKYSDYIDLTLANGEKIKIDCNEMCGDDPEYYIVKT